MKYSKNLSVIAKRLFLLSFAISITACSNLPTHRSHDQPEFSYNVRKLEAPEPPKLAVSSIEDIKASPTRKAADLWTRIRNGMSLDELDSPTVDKYVSYYSSHPEMIDRVFLKASPYLDYILTEIESRHMPTEIALLPFVESGFNPRAVSRTGASGLWQFTANTGKYYRLTQSTRYDGRKDVISSTRAALDYLEDLHVEMQGDWLLALASYNGGPAHVKQVVADLDKELDETKFEDLVLLKKETRNYVPKLLAISRIISTPEQYAIKLPDMPNEKIIAVKDYNLPINLVDISRQIGISLGALKRINPGFKRNTLPGTGKIAIALPSNYVSDIGEQPIQLAKTDKSTAILDSEASFLSDKAANSSNSQIVVIKKGDTLSQLAANYSTTVNSLKNVNNLGSDLIIIGDTLRIPGRLADADVIVAQQSDLKPTNKPTRETGKVTTYQVIAGDSLYKISRLFRTDIASIKHANNLSSDLLHISDSLVIPTSRQAQLHDSPYPVAKTVAHKASVETSLRDAIDYQVGPGDTIAAIARHYGVKSKDIRKWNGLPVTASIKEGQSLSIVPADSYISTSSNDDSDPGALFDSSIRSTRQTEAASNSTTAGNTTAHMHALTTVAYSANDADSSLVRYKVGPGDTLWAIARHYGVGVDKLSLWNALPKTSEISVGQTLKIYPTI